MDRPQELAVIIPAYNEEKCLSATLHALYRQQNVEAFSTVLVDNASTDGTRAVAEKFKAEHSDFDLRVIDENRKGTGYAVSRGFEYAISTLGARVVARTDADATPSARWLSWGVRHLPPTENARWQTVTGPVLAARDEFYRYRDEVIWPAYLLGAAAAYMVIHRNPATFKYVSGANTFIRSSAYEEVGGYPPGAIDDQCEDVALTQAVVDEYGQGMIKWEARAIVRASMRRIRKIGYAGMMNSYVLRPDDSDVRRRVNGGSVDHR